ncbi:MULTISPECIES: hypothetical protein [unclassified Bradyrhizobium]|uniref:hypothetical protein n=1 Tax=unclassified Bradyrhizobium TaxID=2631580 RepID=UPI0028EE681C|nr:MULTISPECIES: hypothetical protein [unclassified Bradyrhizobium]
MNYPALVRKWLAKRLTLPSGRHAIVMRMIARDITAWQSERLHLRAEADATGWLIARLARSPNNTPLAALSDTDRLALVAGIRDMHRSVYGVPMFVEHARTGAPADDCIAEFIDRYATARERFAEAIVLAERTIA